MPGVSIELKGGNQNIKSKEIDGSQVEFRDSPNKSCYCTVGFSFEAGRGKAESVITRGAKITRG